MSAMQIVSGGEGEGFQITPALTQILGKVPADCRVSIISVVGAFRTGKRLATDIACLFAHSIELSFSFLLSVFLRFLRHREAGGKDTLLDSSWLVKEGVAL
jgi:hypothetical protein